MENTRKFTFNLEAIAWGALFILWGFTELFPSLPKGTGAIGIGLVMLFMLIYYRLPGEAWKRTQESAEVAGLNHTVLGGFLDLRPALYACGSGHATFRSFRHVAQSIHGASSGESP